MVHNNDDAMNKIPLKSAGGLDDEEKNGGELMHDPAAAEEARREQMRANVLAWMKKLTIVLICFIGIALISYVIISLCFSDWPKSTPNTAKNNHNNNNTVATAQSIAVASIAAAPISSANAPLSNLAAAESTTRASITTLSTTATDSTATATTTTPTATTTTTTTTKTTTPNPTPTTQPPTTTTTSTTATTPSTTTNPTFKTSPLTDEQLPQDDDNNDSNNATLIPELLEPAVAASTSPTEPTSTLSNKDSSDLRQDRPDISDDKYEFKLGVFEHAAVCSDKQPCSQIASDILALNGSAADAAISALLCNGLLSMQSMGIGGGMLMNVYVRRLHTAFSIDAREVAPFAAEADMFDANPKDSYSGPLSIAVPGELMGYYRAHERFGKLPWRQLVEPSLKICQHGYYYISRHQASALRTQWLWLKDNAFYQSQFLDPETGEPHVAGTRLKLPEQLCKTYQLLADNGPLDFYNGTIAKLLAEDLHDLKSIISSYDLEAYTADLVNSITMDLGQDTLYAMPPVSSGSMVAHTLSILEGFNLTAADMANDEAQARTIHRIVEALKFSSAKRSELGDLRFNDVRELVSQLNSPEFAATQRSKINDSHVLSGPHEYGVQFGSNEDTDGTSHMVVLAPNGDAVSVTSSINAYFGSGLVGPRTGILLNNGMNDFAVENNFFKLPPSQSNAIEPRKRSMSSQSPMLLGNKKDGISLAIGAAGGTRILPAIVEVAVRVLWLGEDLKTAIDAPRFYHQLLPDVLEYESGKFDQKVLQLLEQRGHKLQPLKDPVSMVCAIARNGTAIYANADYRKRGGVAGF